MTAIGLGEDCDLELIDGLADWGGGSSRFISSREKMGEIFGSEFGRMVIPAARNVELELYLLQNLKDVRTWGSGTATQLRRENPRNRRAWQLRRTNASTSPMMRITGCSASTAVALSLPSGDGRA